MRGTGRVWMSAVALLAVLLSACSDSGPSELERAAAEIAAAAAAYTPSSTEVPPTTAPTASTSTSVAATPAAATTPAPAPAGLGPGARGAQVAALEERLNLLHYDVGDVNDVYDQNTAYAVTAFQKVLEMDRTGRATDDVIAALATATAPPALVPTGGQDRVEVDIPRQVLFLYKGGQLAKILTISSGNNKRFCSEGWCRKAVTPGGSFTIYRQARGWETGPLGSLYNPQYFNGGIAIHGSKSVPAQPASHGCIRIPMRAAEWFPGQVHHGMPVHVHGVPGEPPNPAAVSTSTTAPGDTSPTAPPTTTAPVTTTSVPGLIGGLLGPS